MVFVADDGDDDAAVVIDTVALVSAADGSVDGIDTVLEQLIAVTETLLLPVDIFFYFIGIPCSSLTHFFLVGTPRRNDRTEQRQWWRGSGRALFSECRYSSFSFTQ